MHALLIDIPMVLVRVHRRVIESSWATKGLSVAWANVRPLITSRWGVRAARRLPSARLHATTSGIVAHRYVARMRRRRWAKNSLTAAFHLGW